VITAGRRALRLLRRLLSAAAIAALAEHCVLARRWRASSPQLFILGLPRSGTTLVYQYLVHRLRVAYFTNGVGRFHRAPCVTTWWQRRRHGEYRSDFASHYGAVEGPLAPREAGAFWGRFFAVDDRVAAGDLAAAKVRRLRNIVACVQRVFGDRPFINKNVKHLLRLRALAEIFPDAHFLIVTRDSEDVARSLLRARTDLLGDAHSWWSVKPRNFAALRQLEPSDQVAGQVRALTGELDAELARLPSQRVHHIAYEDFCTEPECCVRLLKAALGPLELRNPPEAQFERRGHLQPVALEGITP